MSFSDFTILICILRTVSYSQYRYPKFGTKLNKSPQGIIFNHEASKIALRQQHFRQKCADGKESVPNFFKLHNKGFIVLLTFLDPSKILRKVLLLILLMQLSKGVAHLTIKDLNFEVRFRPSYNCRYSGGAILSLPGMGRGGLDPLVAINCLE